MRILHIIVELLETNGGPPRGLANLARAQAERGDDVAVLPARRTQGAQTLETGRVGNLVCYEAPSDAKLLWYDAALKRRVRELARDRDIIHVHGTWRYHLLAAAGAARAYGIPLVVRPAGNLGNVTRSYKSFRKRAYLALFERRALESAAAIHCCSLKESQELSWVGLRSRVFVVPQAIETDLLSVAPDDAELKRNWPLMPDDSIPLVLFVGRICSIKNLGVLVESFIKVARDHADWHLVMAGPHEEAELVEQLNGRVADAGMANRISLPGMISGGAKAALLRRASIFAQPSQHENFGMSTAEALMFGIPSILSDGVALAAEVADAGAGLSVPSDVDSFESALRRMIDDAEFRASCGRSASGVAAQFAPVEVASQLDTEYRSCTKQMQSRLMHKGS